MPLMAQLTGVVVEAPVVHDAGEAGAGPGGGLVHALPQRLQPAQGIVCYIWRRNARAWLLSPDLFATARRVRGKCADISPPSSPPR